MELLVIVLVLAYSIWSEVSKTKEEDKVDIDFSELASLDDFFNDSGTSTPLVKQKYARGKQPRQPQKPRREAANHGRNGQPAGINYDELPQLTGVVNYDRMGNASKPLSEEALGEKARQMFALNKSESRNEQEEAALPHISFNRESIIKAFVMSEVLQRYNLERIYSRIPNINQEQDD